MTKKQLIKKYNEIQNTIDYLVRKQVAIGKVIDKLEAEGKNEWDTGDK